MRGGTPRQSAVTPFGGGFSAPPASGGQRFGRWPLGHQPRMLSPAWGVPLALRWPPVWRLPPRRSLALLGMRIETAAVEFSGVTLALAWMVVALPAGLGAHYAERAWAHRSRATTAFTGAVRLLASARSVPQAAHRTTVTFRVRLRPYRLNVSFLLVGGLLALALGWLVNQG